MKVNTALMKFLGMFLVSSLSLYCLTYDSLGTTMMAPFWPTSIELLTL